MSAMSSFNNDQNYYDLLEVTVAASPTEIYQAYQRAKATYSPSSPALYSMFTPEEANQLLGLIEEAYQTLSNKTRRQAYDVQIGISKATPKKTMGATPMAPQPAAAMKTETPVAPAASGETWVGQVRIMKKRDDLPKGFARTRFSVYEIKPEIEEEIKMVQECDGQFLQKVRLYKGVNLDQLSEEIKVGKTLLVALEANDVDALPIAVFSRGFVIQFAKVLNLNDKQIADAYMKYFKARKT
jgi:curved DNA-binding protein CbpA